MRVVSLVLALILLGGCGDNGGPDPNPANVEGVWTASLSNMTGSGASCSSSSPTTLSITQEGASFSGTYSGGELTCSGSSGTFSTPVEPGDIVSGMVDGNAVSFDLDTPDFHLTGTADGNAMSGTARWTVDLGTGAVTLNGNWSATR